MTAHSDILAALKAAPPIRPGWERAVLVGASARIWITEESIDGVVVMPTLEFDGWAIRDVDEAGKWHEVNAL